MDAQVDDAVCLACGCMCDDIRLGVRGGAIMAAEGACPVGRQWFLADRGQESQACQVGGRAAGVDEGLRRAADLLCAAEHVLVWGLGGATCEAQRAAVALADRLGARVDAGSSGSTRLAAAVESVGMVTATLGEVRHRADLVIFWGVDPATTHPRHFERYSLSCPGQFVPRGRQDRTCVVVGSERTRTAEAADVFVQIRAGTEAAAAETLRLLAAVEVEGKQDSPKLAEWVAQTGVGIEAWREVAARMKAARYGAMFFAPDEATETLLRLTREMNGHTRFVALPLGGPGNAAGGGQVVAWQTGYSPPVDFAAGYPQRDQRGGSAGQWIEAGDVDAVLVVAQDPLADPFAALSEAARQRLARIASIVLHTADCRPPSGASVAFTVATPGIHAGGSVFRSDGVALRLRPAIGSAHPDAARVLSEMEARVGAGS